MIILINGQEECTVKGSNCHCSWQDPEILIAGRPTAALDVTIPSTDSSSYEKIPKKERNSSIIFIAHDLGVVAGG